MALTTLHISKEPIRDITHLVYDGFNDVANGKKLSMPVILSTIKANHERPDLPINATLITFASSIQMVTEEVDRNTCIYSALDTINII
jgi:hypothetical protein